MDANERFRDMSDEDIVALAQASDGLEQTIILGRGANRLSARELTMEMQQLRQAGIRETQQKPVSRRNPIGERLSPEVRERLEQMRKGYNNRG